MEQLGIRTARATYERVYLSKQGLLRGEESKKETIVPFFK